MANEMRELLISLGYDLDKPRKRRSSEQIEIDKQARIDEELKYDNEVYREQYNLDCLWSEAYMIHYNMDGIRNWHPLDFIDFINMLKDNGKMEELWDLIDALKKGPEQAACYYRKYKLYEYLQNDSKDVKEIIENIKNQDEASFVMDALFATESMLLLPKSYKLTKKNHAKRNKQGRRRVAETYERALRRNRHILEIYLKEIGTGQHRAQKISQILAYL